MRSKVIAAALILVVLVVTVVAIKSYDMVLIRSVYAAESQATASPEPPAGKSSKPADYSQEPFVYEQVRGKMRYENDGTFPRYLGFGFAQTGSTCDRSEGLCRVRAER